MTVYWPILNGEDAATAKTCISDVQGYTTNPALPQTGYVVWAADDPFLSSSRAQLVAVTRHIKHSVSSQMPECLRRIKASELLCYIKPYSQLLQADELAQAIGKGLQQVGTQPPAASRHKRAAQVLKRAYILGEVCYSGYFHH